jgi:hypothetical protein
MVSGRHRAPALATSRAACSHLAAGRSAVAVAPGYGYDDDYYDDGYAYRPSVGVFVGPNYRRWRGRHGWRGHENRAARGKCDRGTRSDNRTSTGVNVPAQGKSGAAVKSFGSRSTMGATERPAVTLLR